MAYLAARSVRLALALILCLVAIGVPAPPVAARALAGVPSPQARVILRLEGAPLGIAAGPTQWAEPTQWAQAAAGPQADALRAQQHQVADAVQRVAPGAEVLHSFSLLLNGLTLQLPDGADAALRERLRHLPGVAAVYEEHAFYPTLFSSTELLGAPEVWEAAGGVAEAGRGVRVAVVDSGIDPTHPMLSTAGMAYPADYPRGDTRYTTEKVIAARMYVRPTDPPVLGEANPVPGPHGSPHGTHLAGIVAGAPVTASHQEVTVPFSGMAPAAWLMNYRVFYPAESGDDVAYTTEILAALEDAVADGADVLLAGWASASGVEPWASPLAAALDAAAAAGCVVVAPVGNAGPALGSASRVPGGDDRVISVGATTKPQEIVRDHVDVLAPEPVMDDLVGGQFGRALFGPEIDALLGPLPYRFVGDVATDEDPHACASLPADSLEGAVAVARRGECPFADKAYHAQAAGAVATVIVNADDVVTELACSGDYCDRGDIRTPTILVARSFGDRLLAWGTLHPEATLQIDPTGRLVDVTADVLAEYSGRGPAYMRGIAPDVVAPGEAVLSAALGDGAAYLQLSGTSVAAAHAAGAAALLRQAHPAWTPDDVRAALMGAADAGVQVLEEEEPRQALPLEQGAGRLDVARAATATLLADPPSLAAPSVLPGGRVEWQVVFRDPRASGAPLTYTLGLSPAAGLSASLGGSLTLAPGEEVTRTLRVTVPAGTAPGEVQTWLVASAGDQEYRLPMWVHVDPPLARGTVLVIDNDFSQFEAYNNYTEYIEDALDGAGHRYTVWDADTRFGNPQTIPDLADLQEFSAVIWVTGDNVHPDGYYELSTPLTAEDQAILARFLDAGGRLLAVGQNLAEASDINPSDDPAYGRGPLLHEYLGAHWLAGSLFGPPEDEVQPPAGVSVVGLPGTFLEGVALDLGEEGDGAGNQTSVDEIAPGGLPDGSDLDHVQPVLAATGGGPVGSGYVGVAKACQPPLEGGAPACPYRTIYYAFGPEGINSGTGVTDRAELLDRSIAWLLDEVSVGIVEAPVGAPQEPILLRSEASSSHGEVVAHRWRVGDRVIDAAEPEVTVLLDAGEYPVRVRARDTLGHEATAAATLRVLPGGGSALLVSPQAANPGQAATYTVRLHNEGAVPLAMGLSLALPEDLEYVAHEGAEYVDGVLAWEGEVAAGATHEATLRVTVGEGAAHEIVATATISAGAETFTRSVRLAVGTHMSLPLIFRQGAP